MAFFVCLAIAGFVGLIVVLLFAGAATLLHASLSFIIGVSLLIYAISLVAGVVLGVYVELQQTRKK